MQATADPEPGWHDDRGVSQCVARRRDGDGRDELDLTAGGSERSKMIKRILKWFSFYWHYLVDPSTLARRHEEQDAAEGSNDGKS